MKPPKPDLNEPLSLEDIREAIEASGYPLEVKLYEQFVAAGLRASIGFQSFVDDEQTVREVDLTAAVDEQVTSGGRDGSFSLMALIAAKKLHTPARFVGVLGTAPEAREQQGIRARRIDGIPSFGIVPPGQDTLRAIVDGTGGFAEAMAPLVGGPVCVHWAVAARRKEEGTSKGRPWASGDRGFWEDFDTTVRTTVALAGSSSVMHLTLPIGMIPEMRILVPTLIVDTSALAIYSPIDGSMREVDWLVLDRRYDVGGAIVRRLVDVVTTSGVASMINRYRAAASLLRSALERHFQQLEAIAKEQQAWWASTGSKMRVPTVKL